MQVAIPALAEVARAMQVEAAIADKGVGIMIMILGAILIVGGIGLSLVILVEGDWWRKLMDGMMASPWPDFGLGSFVPMVQEVMKGMINRVFLYVRLGALLGGPGISLIGILLLILGLFVCF